MSEDTVTSEGTTPEGTTPEGTTSEGTTPEGTTPEGTTPEATTSDSSPTEHRGYRKTRRGYVVSDKMDKTVVVEVEDRVKHALYGKVMRRTTKVKAHDEANSCGVGDSVRIMETRPMAASKRWRVVEILEKAK